MPTDKEVCAKIAAAQEQAIKNYGEAQGSVGAYIPKCASPGLKERIENYIYRSEKEKYKLDKLQELKYLMDKHSDVARMLEILDALKEI